MLRARVLRAVSRDILAGELLSIYADRDHARDAAMKSQQPQVVNLLTRLAGIVKRCGALIYGIAGLIIGGVLFLGAVAVVVVVIVLLPIDYFRDLMDSWQLGAWGRVVILIFFLIYLALLFFGGVGAVWVWERWFSRSASKIDTNNVAWYASAEERERKQADGVRRRRETRIPDWMKKGKYIGGVAALILLGSVGWQNWARLLLSYENVAILMDLEENLDKRLYLDAMKTAIDAHSNFFGFGTILLMLGFLSWRDRLSGTCLVLLLVLALLEMGISKVVFVVAISAVFVAVCVVLGREVGWIAATLVNGWEDRRVR